MAEHTQTPWECDGIDIRSKGLVGRQIALCEISVRGRPYDETYDEALANAAFIVKACNAHETLVKRLEQIARAAERIKGYATEHMRLDACADEADFLCRLAEDAIRQVGGP